MNEELLQIFRFKPGFVGDTTRVLSEYYFNFCFTDGDLRGAAYALINHRNSLYYQLDEVDTIEEENVQIIVDTFFNNIPAIILIFCYLESSDPEIREIFNMYLQDIYNLVTMEHEAIAKNMNCTPILEDLTDHQAYKLSDLLDRLS